MFNMAKKLTNPTNNNIDPSAVPWLQDAGLLPPPQQDLPPIQAEPLMFIDNDHELHNPQLQVSTLGTIPNNQMAPTTIDTASMVDPTDSMQDQMNAAVDSYNAFMEQQNNNQPVTNMAPQFQQQPMVETSAPTVIQQESQQQVATVQQPQPTTINNNKVQYINKESFGRFVNALSILKNLKQNIIFTNGATQFVSDSKSYVCKFDTHCPDISFRIPFVEQQATQLGFLTRSDSVSILESEDDYVFSDGQFKFQLRKTIADSDTWNNEIYNRFYQDITSKPLIADYKFTDQNHLFNFLSIIKGIKRGNLGFVTSANMKQIIVSRGDINSGKFELLTIPCNIGATNNQPIDSVFDSVAILQDYLSLDFQFYYNTDGSDSISIVMNGTISGGFDVTFISTAYRQFTSSLIS